MRQYAYFSDLPVTTEFILNGDRCVKQSSRTLRLVDYDAGFYPTAHMLCVVGRHSVLPIDNSPDRETAA